MKLNFDKQFEEKYKNNPDYNKLMKIMNSQENKIGDEFLQTRIPKGLTQNDAANLLNISLEEYIKIESGSSHLAITTLNNYLNDIKAYTMIAD